MRNLVKILCVVLALVMALSAASCSLTKQYSYKTDDVELPIGVYIYYLFNAYNQAQSYAQKSDKYDSEAGTYDGKDSFLSLEITDDDGKTAVAEQWILDKAEESMNEAAAVYYEFNKLEATMDEAALSETRSAYKDYWDNGYDYYGYQQPALSETYEPYGIGFDSFFIVEATLRSMRDEVFKREYAVDGPQGVSDDELQKYFDKEYTSYKYFSANLYTSTTDEAGTSSNVAMTKEESDKLIKSFASYAKEVKKGAAISDVVTKYNEEYSASATATENVTKIDADTEDEIMQTILSLKEGQAVSKTIGDSDTSKQVYVIYKAPIKSEKDYLADDANRSSVLQTMKSDDFTEFLKTLAAAINIDKSSAIGSYKPSMFEQKKDDQSATK